MASAVLVLCTVLGSAACSSSADSAPPSGSSTSADDRTSQREADRAEPDPSRCATSAEKMPEGCEVDLDVSEISEATPATKPPSTK
ncbi:hypothetical protein [Streptomyces sp. WG-D5]